MASAQAINHKEKMAKAYAAMDGIGLPRYTITPILKQLLKIYNNEWDFIESENYRLLADQALEHQEAQANKSSPFGPVTRARRAQSEVDASENSDDSPQSPPRGRSETPSPPARTARPGGRAPPTTPSPARLQHNAGPDDGLPVGVLRGVEYHSGSSVRRRAACQDNQSLGCSRGTRSQASAALEMEKGKMPLISDRRVAESRRQPPRDEIREVSRKTGPPPKLVTVKLEVCATVPAPEGFEKVAFEKVDGVITPAVRRSQNGSHTAERPDQQVALTTSCVTVEAVEQHTVHLNSLGTRICPPAAPGLASSKALVKVKSEPLEENVSHDVQGDEQAIHLPLVDYLSDEEPLEPMQQGTIEGCDLALIPVESSEHRDPLDIQVNREEIRPRFILRREGPSVGEECLEAPNENTAKRDIADPKEISHSKRQKCDTEPSITTWLRNGRIDGINGSGPSATSIGPSSFSVPDHLNGDGKNCALHQTTNGHTEDRAIVVFNTKAQGSTNPPLKRVKIEPGFETLNELPRPLQMLPPKKKKARHDPADISRGTERVPIPFINEYTSETITRNFKYIPSNVVFQDAYINISLARIGDEDCCMTCMGDCLEAPHPCACTRETGGEFAYTLEGLLKPEYIQSEVEKNQDPVLKGKPMTYCATGWDCPIERAKDDFQPEKCKGHVVRKFVKECWHKCGCSMHCGNRVVQRGISRNLQVFFTNDGKGWGIRTTEDLPTGAFVCEYVGEIMTNMELDQRNEEKKKCNTQGISSPEHKDTYPVLLDGDWCSEKGLKDEEALCLDATYYGNVARFINHRCFDANLIDIPVTIDSQDRHYYHVAFFTNRLVLAGEELTWDYKIDFEDNDHPIEAFKCLCKSPLCRDGAASSIKKHKK